MMVQCIGIDATDALQISAKTGVGIPEVLAAIVERLPAPEGDADAPLKAMLVDSWYDPYLGVVVMIRVIDGMIRKEGRGVTGWIAASWLKTERSFPDFRSGLADPPDESYPPIFDRRLDVDLVLRWDIFWGMNAGLRWNLGTGVPYTRPEASYPYLNSQLTNGGRLTDEGGGPDQDAIYLGPRNGTRYPTYHRLDMSFRKTFNPSWGVITPYLQILNLYDQRNVLFYFFEYDQLPATRTGVSMFPFFPTFGLEVSF